MQNSKKSNNKQKKANNAKKKPAPKRAPNPVSLQLSYARPQKKAGPAVQRQISSADGRITVRNREYIKDVLCNSSFTAESISVNPGLSSTFQWLANLANNYEFYHFKSLTFEYEPTASANTPGNVILAMDYDAADDAPANKQRLMSYMGAEIGTVYRRLSCRSSPSNLSKAGVQKYTRAGLVPDGKDVKTYDVANLILATDGGQGITTGMLFVSYVVELMTPHSPVSFPWEDSAKVTAAPTVLLQPFPDAPTTTFVNADPADPIVERASTSQFLLKKAGDFMLELSAIGTGLTAADLATMLASATGSILTLTIGGGIGAGATSYLGAVRVRSPRPNTSFTLALPAAWSTISGIAMRVAPYLASLDG